MKIWRHSMWKRSDPVESAKPHPDTGPSTRACSARTFSGAAQHAGWRPRHHRAIGRHQGRAHRQRRSRHRRPGSKGRSSCSSTWSPSAQHATVRAQVSAREVVVLGHVVGNIKATDKVDIKEHGRVEGDIVSPTVAIADGAHFHGSIDMQRATTQTDKAAGKDAAAILNSRSSRTEPRPQPAAQSIKIGPPRPHSTHA